MEQLNQGIQAIKKHYLCWKRRTPANNGRTLPMSGCLFSQ